MSYLKRTRRSTTQEQQEKGKYRRSVKQDSSLTQINTIKNTWVMLPSNMVLFYQKLITWSTELKQKEEGQYTRGVKQGYFLQQNNIIKVQ